MNDRLPFSTAASGMFNARTELAGGVLPADEDYSLRFALTSLPAERLYFEPFVSFRLNGPRDETFAIRPERMAARAGKTPRRSIRYPEVHHCEGQGP